MTTTANGADSLTPDIVTLSDGRVAAVWADVAADGTGLGIAMRILDARDGSFSGTAGADTLYGNNGGADTFAGLGGADIILGLGGDDTLSGDAGNDRLDCGAGNDELHGGADADSMAGGPGDDDLFGEAGNDALRGGAGADLLNGGTDTDAADYRITTSVTLALDASLAGLGEAAGDTFVSIEKVLGSLTGADAIRGDALANSLFGYGGADMLDGRGGNDKLNGGAGTDTLTGGAGLDRFEFFAPNLDADFITDFTAADDTIAVLGAAFSGLAPGGLAAAGSSPAPTMWRRTPPSASSSAPRTRPCGSMPTATVPPRSSCSPPCKPGPR